MEEFSGKRERYITWQDMNKHLSYIKRNHYLIRYDKHLRGESLYLTAYIEDKPVYFRLTYKVGSYVCTYIVRKDEKPVMDQVSGTQAFQLLSRYYKVPRVDKRFCGRADEGGMSAAPFLYCNPKYEKQWLFAYGYDLNKAYGSAMLIDMPDTSVPPRTGIIEKGKEIGFIEVENEKRLGQAKLAMLEEGWAPYIFPLMPSPFVKFIERRITNIKNAKTEEEVFKEKEIINKSVGYLQKVNPFLRARIVNFCNKRVQMLMDENTVLCNTDSIVSLVPRNDLDIGEEVGQWKVENAGNFAFIGLNYQWKNAMKNKIAHRGVPLSWLPKDFDILRDPWPSGGNVLEYDYDEIKLKKVRI